jgi:competence protein ComGF
MPLNTLTEMILGFAVIIGVLLLYVISLIIRTQKAKSRYQADREE